MSPGWNQISLINRQPQRKHVFAKPRQNNIQSPSLKSLLPVGGSTNPFACENWIISPKIGANKIYQMTEVSPTSDSHLLPSFCPRQSSGPLSCCLNHSGTKHGFSSFESNYIVCQNHGFLIYPVIWVHHCFSATKIIKQLDKFGRMNIFFSASNSVVFHPTETYKKHLENPLLHVVTCCYLVRHFALRFVRLETRITGINKIIEGKKSMDQ